MNLQPGKIVDGKYTIIRRLGTGGMGSVYLATHESLERPVAIKVMQEQLLDDTTVARFEREALAISTLKHRNIVRLYSYGLWHDCPYMVLEHVDGISLQEYIEERRLLSVEESLSITRQICEGLQCAHANGIVHRDLKPGNIMLERKGFKHDETQHAPLAKIIDFGLAKPLQEFGQDLQSLTDDGMAVGTRDYMSPEQCLGQPIDARSDIYSAGCILVRCLTGNVPYVAECTMMVMQQHVSAAPPQLEDFPDIPPAVRDIVYKAMSKVPAERYQSAAEMADDINVFLDKKVSEMTSSSTAIPPPQKQTLKSQSIGKNKFFSNALVAISVTVSISVFALITLTSRPNEDHRQTSFQVLQKASKRRDDGGLDIHADKASEMLLQQALQLDKTDHLLEPGSKLDIYGGLINMHSEDHDPGRAIPYVKLLLALREQAHIHGDWRNDLSVRHFAQTADEHGKRRSAVSLLSGFLSMPPEYDHQRDRYDDILQSLARILIHQGKPKEALSLLAKLPDIHKDNGLYLSGEAHLMTGDYKKALSEEEEFIDQHKDSAEWGAYLFCIKACIANDEWNKAKTYLAPGRASWGEVPMISNGIEMLFLAHDGNWKKAQRLKTTLLAEEAADPRDFESFGVHFDLQQFSSMLKKANLPADAELVAGETAKLQDDFLRNHQD